MKRRRTMLFSPASNPKMLYSSHICKPDCIIFDLEDAVSYDDKIPARDLLIEALKVVDYGDCEIFCRINPLYTPFGKDDVKELVAAGLRNIRLPMCESKENIIELDELLNEVEKANNIELGTVKIQGAIETLKGVKNAYEIATASKRVVSISFGAEDFTRQLGVNRTAEGKELFLARSSVVMAAKMAGVDPIDTVWANLGDEEGFIKEVKDAKNLGFAGKSCIHPSQVELANEIFSPSKEEVQAALKIMQACKDANITEKGGVILVDGKMVDGPIITKAENILKMANITLGEC